MSRKADYSNACSSLRRKRLKNPTRVQLSRTWSHFSGIAGTLFNMYSHGTLILSPGNCRAWDERGWNWKKYNFTNDFFQWGKLTSLNTFINPEPRTRLFESRRYNQGFISWFKTVFSPLLFEFTVWNLSIIFFDVSSGLLYKFNYIVENRTLNNASKRQ